MIRSLPPNPSLRFLQKEAKDLLKAQRRGDPGACETLRLLRRFHAAQDGEILAADVSLHEAQFGLAMDYGFPSWPAMKSHVDAVSALTEGAPAGPVGDADVRLVLKGVPKIGFHRRMCPFPAAVEAVLEFLGRPEPYDYLMGVSGAAFRRIWHRDDGGNVDLSRLQPEPHRLLFRAIGFDYHVLPAADGPVMTDAVKASIAAGKPVIGFGIIGPPEAGLVCGYDRGGEVLLGHSYFDFEKHPPEAPYYQKADWFEDMRGAQPQYGEPRPMGMIVLGEPGPRPQPREVLRTSLAWAIDLARVSRRANLPSHVCGLAAYDAWAHALEVEADYEDALIDPDSDDLTAPRSIIETRVMVHGDQATMLYERTEAAAFLRRMAQHAGQGADLLQEAAGLYEQVGKTNVWPWKAKHYMAKEVKEGVAVRDVRHRFARDIRQAAAAETQAVALLERALQALDHAG